MITRITRNTPGVTPPGMAVQQSDGTITVIPSDPAADDRRSGSEDLWPSVDAATGIDALRAIQLAVADILAALRPRSFDLLTYLKTGVANSREMEFHRVFFDYATQDDDQIPCPSAAIRRYGEGVYEGSGLSNTILEETADVFGPGTVCETSGTFSQGIEVLIMTAHKDDRAGVRKAIEDAFLGEVGDQRPGRRVVVPAYYGRTVRLALLAMDHPGDGPGTAQANEWLLQVRLQGTVDATRLVRRPAYLEHPSTNVTL